MPVFHCSIGGHLVRVHGHAGTPSDFLDRWERRVYEILDIWDGPRQRAWAVPEVEGCRVEYSHIVAKIYDMIVVVFVRVSYVPWETTVEGRLPPVAVRQTCDHRLFAASLDTSDSLTLDPSPRDVQFLGCLGRLVRFFLRVGSEVGRLDV